MADYDTILYDVQDGVATLTINRPDQFNGMNVRMLNETYDCLVGAAADPGVRILVLTGAGRAFCPGADLKASSSGTLGERDRDDKRSYHVARILHEMPALTIAAINGACAGAGFGWACGADIRVATRSANFATAFLKVAVAGDMGVPWSLPRLVGQAKARELSFLCEKFSADEAKAAGFVARVWDDDAFRGEVANMVAFLAAQSPLALKTMKAHYVAAEKMEFKEYLELETERHHYLVSSDDFREAARAFVEKRAPKFAPR
ncbi:MAG: enoyl-CoA hydratase/isomerase family protein [Dehalococcoidia bacterium]|nr:enoyl-CoA hydratase/isomerase family protein [Dehalococcoidia bacterium]